MDFKMNNNYNNSNNFCNNNNNNSNSSRLSNSSNKTYTKDNEDCIIYIPIYLSIYFSYI